jgi:phosphoglycolate phosphatase
MPQRADARSVGAILFDLDGTLVDSAPSMTRALNEMAQRRGTPPVEASSVRRWVSLGGEVMLRGALGDQTDPVSDLEELRNILRQQTADPGDLYPGVPAMLAALRQDGYRLAICTNKREDIAVPYLAGLGIADYFEAIIGGAQGRRLKPDPQLAHMALEQLSAQPGEAIFVGDSEIDAETAAAAGTRFVLVTFGYPHGEIDAIAANVRIDSFSELIPLANVLTRGAKTMRRRGPFNTP